jgi:3-dehydroquinate dehydratase
VKDVKVVGVITYFPIQSAYIRGLKKYVDILEMRADYLQDRTQDAVEKIFKNKTHYIYRKV